MKSFLAQLVMPRVVFGAGAVARLESELAQLGATRVGIVTSGSQRGSAESLAARIGSRFIDLYGEVAQHVPVEHVLRAREWLRRRELDALIALGGGSTVGLVKALALEDEVKLIAIPTTYSGSEMTPIFGITEAGAKRTGRSERVLPKLVIYDAELTRGLPARMSMLSGLNALAHAVEALYAQDRHPFVEWMAEEGARSLALGLPRLQRDLHGMESRELCLYGAWLCGAVLGNAGMGLHHKLCHILGGLGLPHAEVHAVLLPHVAAYNFVAAPAAMARLGLALDAKDAPGALRDLAERLGAPLSLAELGLAAQDLDRVAERAVESPYPNPRRLDRDAIRGLLACAHRGDRPEPSSEEAVVNANLSYAAMVSGAATSCATANPSVDEVASCSPAGMAARGSVSVRTDGAHRMQATDGRDTRSSDS